MRKKKFYFGRMPSNTKFGMYLDKRGKLHWAIPHLLVKHFKGRKTANLANTTLKLASNSMSGAYAAAGITNEHTGSDIATRRILKKAEVAGSPHAHYQFPTEAERSEAKQLIEEHDKYSEISFRDRINLAVDRGYYTFPLVDVGSPMQVVDMICALDNLGIPRHVQAA